MLKNYSKIGLKVTWQYDRSVRSTLALANALKKFQSLGIEFTSYQEGIDTTTPTNELIFLRNGITDPV